jgi:hypothetical protein
MQKRLALLCVLLMLLSALVVSFHHHEDGVSHDDCPICLAVHNSSSAAPEFSDVQRNNDAVPFRSEISFILPNTVLDLGNTRAPPA